MHDAAFAEDIGLLNGFHCLGFTPRKPQVTGFLTQLRFSRAIAVASCMLACFWVRVRLECMTPPVQKP